MIAVEPWSEPLKQTEIDTSRELDDDQAQLLFACNNKTPKMRFTLRSPSWLLVTAATLCCILPTNALYFYMDATTPRCFMEELPKDTLVVGT